jgi:hypothetical protein
VPLGEEREDLCRQRVPSKDLDGVIRLGDFRETCERRETFLTNGEEGRTPYLEKLQRIAFGLELTKNELG